MIDLHLHTTASDGRHEPAVLVDLAWRAGIRTMSVTDHDTVAAVGQAATIAARSGMGLIPGIEITAVHGDRDIHVLGYYIELDDARMLAFLEHQRADRVRRVSAMVDRLAALGKPIDRASLQGWSDPRSGRAIGRPMIAQALVKAGHVSDTRQAFDELIGDGRAAYVPRQGAAPAEVIAIISAAGGVASLAHPGLLRRDDLIPELVGAGLGALEAFHSEHDEPTTMHYLELARTHDLAVSGGSDYHGEDGRRKRALGAVHLPSQYFEALASRAGKDGR